MAVNKNKNSNLIRYNKSYYDFVSYNNNNINLIKSFKLGLK